MHELPRIKNYAIYGDRIYTRILAWMDEILWNAIDGILEKPLLNSADLISDLLSGKIHYEKGHFIPNAKGFNNAQARELEKIGARYNRVSKTYTISPDKIPVNIQQAIARVDISNERRLDDIVDYIKGVEDSIEYVANKFDLYDDVEKIGEGLDRQLKASLKTVNIIPYELTDYQLKELSTNYTNNLKFYIQNWAKDRIPKLREGIQDLAMQGWRGKKIEEYIKNQKQMDDRKAKFLARQETKLFVAEYQKNRFKEQGISQYKWSAVMDNRTRQEHRELNGRIFSWDEPPVIDTRTGERGNPSEAYNCRCIAIPVVTNEFWEKNHNLK